MPNISDYDDRDEWMVACVPERIIEGEEQERAVAACLNMWRDKHGEEAEGIDEDAGKVKPQAHEYKTFPSLVTDTDEEQGIVDAVFAVFGNVDEGKDIVHPGSFSKTFAERGRKVRVLDQHNTRSILNVIGKPLELRELKREQLPAPLLEEFPDATGGAFAKVQFLMDVPEGRGAFVRLRDGAVDEWSFGYDVLDADFSKERVGGEEVTVRNLRTLKLYEISPVIWGMNPATMTVGAKDDEDATQNNYRLAGGLYVGETVDDLLAQKQEAMIEAARAWLAAAEAQREADTDAPDATDDEPKDNTAPADAGRVEDADDAGAEPPQALTPEEEARRLALIEQIQRELEV